MRIFLMNFIFLTCGPYTSYLATFGTFNKYLKLTCQGKRLKKINISVKTPRESHKIGKLVLHILIRKSLCML